MAWHTRTAIMPLIGLVFLLSGCAALVVGAAAGAGGAVYVMGKLQDELPHPVPTVQQAAVKGLENLQLPILESKADQLTGKLESQLADERRIWIDLQGVDKGHTRVSIRVGLIGDEVHSRRILEAIKKQLPAPAG